VIPLRILHLATSPAAAADGDVLTTMTWLKAQGHQAALAAGGASNDGSDLPGVELMRYRGRALAWWLGGKRGLLAQVTAFNPDVVHLHGIAALPAARAVARACGVPVVASLDQALPPARARGLRDPVVAWTLVPTEAHRGHYVARVRLERDRVPLVPFAIDPLRVVARTPGLEPEIGMLAGGDGDGAELLLDAVARLRAGNLPVRVLLGLSPDDHEGHERVGEAIATRGAQAWAELVELVRPSDLLARCDVVATPAGEDRGCAFLIAALAAGRPVVAAATTGVNELVQDGRTGLLVAPGDTEAWAAALGRVVRDQPFAAALAAAAREDARFRFDIGVVGPALVELYRSAISAEANPSAKAESTRAYQRRVSR
jgi:glycosyltransferase involved in cell wall biosynthesis